MPSFYLKIIHLEYEVHIVCPKFPTASTNDIAKPESQIRHYLYYFCQKLLLLSMNYIFFTLSPTNYQVKGNAPAENLD